MRIKNKNDKNFYQRKLILTRNKYFDKIFKDENLELYGIMYTCTCKSTLSVYLLYTVHNVNITVLIGYYC